MGGAYSFGVSRKGKKVFRCDLLASSEAGGETGVAEHESRTIKGQSMSD